MTENVRKVFDMLGVEPYEKFKFGEEFDKSLIYWVDENLIIHFSYKEITDTTPFCLSKLIRNPELIIKLPKKKHVGDLICKDLNCKNCPLHPINCFNDENNNLYQMLEGHYTYFDDKEIYDILKKRLDKEVEE